MASRVIRPTEEPFPRAQRESADNYENVILVLNDNWRIALSKGGTEWLLQHRSEDRSGKTRWKTTHRYPDPSNLLPRIRELCGQIDDDTYEAIASVADRGGRRK
jgi:hypothetical protein